MKTNIVNLKQLIVLATLTLVTICGAMTSAYAGAKDGGGGGAFACPSGYAYLLDLVEGTVPYFVTDKGLNIVRSTTPVEAQITNALAKLYVFGKKFGDLVTDSYRVAKLYKMQVPANMSISPPQDAFNDMVLKGCTLVGVAKYNDSIYKLWMDDTVIKTMPPTDQAALWIHESVYKVLRAQLGMTNSTLARKVTAAIFSDEPSANYRSLVSSNAKFTDTSKHVPAGTLEINETISPNFTIRASCWSSSYKEAFINPWNHSEWIDMTSNMKFSTIVLAQNNGVDTTKTSWLGWEVSTLKLHTKYAHECDRPPVFDLIDVWGDVVGTLGVSKDSYSESFLSIRLKR